VITTKHGRPHGGGAEFTPLGHCVVEQYRSIEDKAHLAVAAELAALAAAALKSRPER
jgi:molybdate transport system regulatory protein